MLTPTHIRRIRQTRGWSIGQLARAAGLPETTVGHLDRGRGLPGGRTLIALARALDCTTDELLGLSGEEPQKAG